MRPPLRTPPSYTVLCLVLGALCVAAAATAVALGAIDAPFADAWRHYARLLRTPFPRSVLAADNGHVEIVANLVRWAALRWAEGSERLQSAIGLGFALATWGVLMRRCAAATDAPRPARAGAALAFTLALFWLGNGRALLHANDALHVYSVVGACVLACVAALGGPALSLLRTAAAGLACLAAVLCFGSGFAAFGAVAILLFLRRAQVRHYVALGAVAVLCVALYAALAGTTATLAWHPVAQVLLALRVVAAPAYYALWPAFDPAAAAALPAAVRGGGIALAQALLGLVGDARTRAWPFAGVGFAFCALLAWQTWVARRDGATPLRQLALALAWFGLGASFLVGALRVDYFAAHAEQAFAPRYLPWSSLAWGGALAALQLRPGAGRGARCGLLAATLLAAFGEVGVYRVMRHEAQDALATQRRALLAPADLPWTAPPSENVEADVRAGAAALRAARVGIFAAGLPRYGEEPDGQWRAVRAPMLPLAEQGAWRSLALNPDCTPSTPWLLLTRAGRVVGLAQAQGDAARRGEVPARDVGPDLAVLARGCAP